MINNGGLVELAVAEKRTQVGGDWFFWIAGLSIANALLVMMRVPVGFFFGLGITEYAARAALGVGGWLAVTGIAAAFFAFYGLFARKGQQWAFIVGALFYLMDALLLLSIHQYLEVAAHAYALYCLFQGFQAAQRLGVLRAQAAAMARAGYAPPSSTPGVWPPPPSV